MKVIKVTKEYFQTEDEKIPFFEPIKLCPNCKAEISNMENNWEKHCLHCAKDFCSRCVDSHDCGCALTGALTPLGERLAEIKKKLKDD